MLQFQGKSKQERFIEAVTSLNLSFPGVEIASKLDKGEPTVSLYLSGAREVSDKFLKIFCKEYHFDFDEIRGTGKFAKNENPGVEAPGLTSDQKLIKSLETDLATERVINKTLQVNLSDIRASVKSIQETQAEILEYLKGNSEKGIAEVVKTKDTRKRGTHHV